MVRVRCVLCTAESLFEAQRVFRRQDHGEAVSLTSTGTLALGCPNHEPWEDRPPQDSASYSRKLKILRGVTLRTAYRILGTDCRIHETR